MQTFILLVNLQPSNLICKYFTCYLADRVWVDRQDQDVFHLQLLKEQKYLPKYRIMLFSFVV